MAKIEALDRWQIQHVYFHPTDKNGEIVVRKKAKQGAWSDKHRRPRRGSPEFQTFWDWAKSYGWADWMIRHLWPKELAWQNARREKYRDKSLDPWRKKK